MTAFEYDGMRYEFCYVHGEEYGDHECDDPPEENAYQSTDLRGPRCNLCHHQIYKLGMDWVCTENCRCVMIGCIPKKTT